MDNIEKTIRARQIKTKRIIEKLKEHSTEEWDIFQDLINTIGEDGDEIYILAEDMSDKGRCAIFNILYNIVANTFPSYEYDYFRSNFIDFEIELNRTIQKIMEYNKEYDYAGDDNWIYAISSLKLPLHIKEFCTAFNRYDIAKWVDDSKICQKSIQMYWQLDGIWDYICVRHRQQYGDMDV